MPRPKNTHFSRRSELSGLIGIACHWISTCKRPNIVEVDVEVRWDGLEAVKLNTKFTGSMNARHFDLVTTLKLLLRETLQNVEFGHVKGH